MTGNRTPIRFTRRAVEAIAENRIREAIAEGRFDNLPGEGKPIPGIDEPYDELWWVRAWIRRERLRDRASARRSALAQVRRGLSRHHAAQQQKPDEVR